MQTEQLRRNRFTLAFIFGAHVLVATFWLHARRQPAPARTVDEPATIMMRLFTEPAPAVPARAQPAAIHPPRPMPLATVAPAAAADAATTHDTAAPETPAPVSMPQSAPRFSLDQARRQAGRSANDGNAAPVSAQPASRWTRFRSELADAHAEPTTGVQQDSYTASDGTVIYRKKIGTSTLCRKSGSVGGVTIGGVGGVGDAGWVDCPSDAAWQREP